jgi:hypothetical protein
MAVPVPCPPGNYGDLAEHISSVITILGILAAIIAALFWRMLTRMENKIDEIQDLRVICKDEFVSKKEFGDWQISRGPLWDRLNHHKHDAKGKVVINGD